MTGVALDVGYELQGFLVALLRADATLRLLLFSALPPVAAGDERVYAADAHLPLTEVREVLPRVIVAVREQPYEAEQASSGRSPGPAATCLVTVHVFDEADSRGRAERITARVRDVLSTPLSSASIIVGELVPESSPPPAREVAFRNAWRLTREYRAQLVGVL